jgi:hypothetical protein
MASNSNFRRWFLANSLKIIYWWDTEDYINPQSDDALLLLLKEFEKRSMPAVFKMVGEKTRVLIERGRKDIIGLLKNDLFEIGYHTDMHSAHPTIAEYTEHLDWQEGMGEILLNETAGLDVTRETFGKEIVCYGQPGSSYTPFVYGAMRAWGVPAYLGGGAYLGDDVFPTSLHGLFNMARMNGASSSFNARQGDKAPKLARGAMTKLIKSLPDNAIISHCNHPNEWSLEKWWDEVNFMHGAAPLREEWKPAPLVPSDEMKRRVALYGEYLDWVKAQGVSAITVKQAMALYSSGRNTVRRKELAPIAAKWAKGEVDGYLNVDENISLSAAQVLYLLAQAVQESCPDTLFTGKVDAPVFIEGLSTGEMFGVSRDAMARAAETLANHIRSCGTVPAMVEIPGQKSVPPAAIGVALGRLLTAKSKSIKVAAGEVRFLPAEKVKVYGKDLGPWSIHHEGFTGANLVEYTKLLSWSYRRLFNRSGG